RLIRARRRIERDRVRSAGVAAAQAIAEDPIDRAVPFSSAVRIDHLLSCCHASGLCILPFREGGQTQQDVRLRSANYWPGLTFYCFPKRWEGNPSGSIGPV